MFVHTAIHYPRREHVSDVLASMYRVNNAAEGTPGLIQMGAWREENSSCLVGLAMWASREALAVPSLVPTCRLRNPHQ